MYAGDRSSYSMWRFLITVVSVFAASRRLFPTSCGLHQLQAVSRNSCELSPALDWTVRFESCPRWSRTVVFFFFFQNWLKNLQSSLRVWKPYGMLMFPVPIYFSGVWLTISSQWLLLNGRHSPHYMMWSNINAAKESACAFSTLRGTSSAAEKDWKRLKSGSWRKQLQDHLGKAHTQVISFASKSHHSIPSCK